MTIDQLMIAVIQAQDVDTTISELTKAGFSVTHSSSTGGFLGTRNETLLIGLSQEQEGEVLRILGETCRRRVEYIATPLEGAPFHLPLTTPVTVGGATVFNIKVEHFEVIR